MTEPRKSKVKFAARFETNIRSQLEGTGLTEDEIGLVLERVRMRLSMGPTSDSQYHGGGIYSIGIDEIIDEVVCERYGFTI